MGAKPRSELRSYQRRVAGYLEVLGSLADDLLRTHPLPRTVLTVSRYVEPKTKDKDHEHFV